MKVIVADTSPLNYLVLIGEVGILPALYGSLIIPHEVFVELNDLNTPLIVRDWTRELPAWIEVRSTSVYHDVPVAADLDSGERAAIQLARAQDEALLLIDDAAGRREATRLGLPTIGTLGLLRLAAIEKLVELQTALSRLLETNFRAPGSLIRNLVAEDEDRRRPLEL